MSATNPRRRESMRAPHAPADVSRPLCQILVFTATTRLIDDQSVQLADLDTQHRAWRGKEFGPRYIHTCFQRLKVLGYATISDDLVTLTAAGRELAAQAYALAKVNATGYGDLLPASHQQVTPSSFPSEHLPGTPGMSEPESPLLMLAPLATRPGLQSFD
jgi:hypothetical protein